MGVDAASPSPSPDERRKAEHESCSLRQQGGRPDVAPPGSRHRRHGGGSKVTLTDKKLAARLLKAVHR
jgi:hypothetical protein